MPFISEIPIRFGDTDYARIVYYPRLLHLLHVAFEELFDRHVLLSYATLMEQRQIGFPTVKLSCEFHAPIRFGELLRVAIWVPEIGRSSVTFAHRVTVDGDDDVRVTAVLKRVAVDMRSLKSIPIPDDLRTSFATLTS